MSRDTVDLLHSAEDKIGTLETVLTDIAIALAGDPNLFADMLISISETVVRAGFGKWDGDDFVQVLSDPYCRGCDDSDECESECCGCPCHG